MNKWLALVLIIFIMSVVTCSIVSDKNAVTKLENNEFNENDTIELICAKRCVSNTCLRQCLDILGGEE